MFEFKEVESLDTVPEQFRPLYGGEAGEDGKFRLNPAFTLTAQSFAKIDQALRAERKAHQDTKGKTVDLSPLADWGSNPEEIRNTFSARLEEAVKSGKVDVGKIQEGVRNQMKGEVDKATQRAQALQSQLYGLMVNQDASSAIRAAGGEPDLLLPIVAQRAKVVETDGRCVVQVFDAAGNIEYGASGEPMTIKELVENLKASPTYGRAFSSEAPRGGGKPPSSTPASIPRSIDSMSSVDKIAAGLAERSRRR